MALQVKHKRCVSTVWEMVGEWERVSFLWSQSGGHLIKMSRNLTQIGSAGWSHGNAGVCFFISS